MSSEAENILEQLLKLRAAHGSFNSALVHYYVQVHGVVNLSQISRDLGVSRSTVRRVLRKGVQKGQP